MYLIFLAKIKGKSIDRFHTSSDSNLMLKKTKSLGFKV